MNTVILIGNSTIIELRELTRAINDTVDTGATVTVTLVDTRGNEVSGETWPKTLAHVSGGTYRATLAAGIGIQKNHRYIAQVTAVSSYGETFYEPVEVTAVEHDC